MLKKEKCTVAAVLLSLCSILVVFGVLQYGGLPCFDADAEDIIITEGEKLFYTDVKETNWFFEDVRYVSDRGIMNGMDSNLFSPHTPTSRGMLVTILWRLENKPDAGKTITFSDATKEAFYYPAVCWAAENKIVSGYDEMHFGPEDIVTREQMVTILFRFMTYKGYDCKTTFNLSTFIDENEISEYAIEAVKWACYNEILTGTTDNNISPKEHATRCHVAAVMHRICENFFDRSEEKKPVEPDAVDVTKKISSTDRSETKTYKSYKNNTSSTNEEKLLGVNGEENKREERTESSEEQSKQETVSQESTVPTIVIKRAEAKVGENLVVEAEIQNNPGILGMTLSIEYDESALRLLSVRSGKAVADVLTFTPSKSLQSGAKMAWDGLDMSPDDAKDGPLLEMEFEVSKNADTKKSYPIVLKYGDGDIVDYDIKEIKPKIINGYVTIE